jgi:hypothetical protein
LAENEVTQQIDLGILPKNQNKIPFTKSGSFNAMREFLKKQPVDKLCEHIG